MCEIGRIRSFERTYPVSQSVASYFQIGHDKVLNTSFFVFNQIKYVNLRIISKEYILYKSTI